MGKICHTYTNVSRKTNCYFTHLVFVFIAIETAVSSFASHRRLKEHKTLEKISQLSGPEIRIFLQVVQKANYYLPI